VKIIGTLNLAGRLSADASSLYSRNLFNFLAPLIDKTTKALKIDWNDEIIKGTCLTRDGEVVHASVKAA
jgi:NAD(P) transhydrogenase subunit alpha